MFPKTKKNSIDGRKRKGTYSNNIFDWMHNHKVILLIILSFIILVGTYSSLGYRIPILDEGVYVGMGKSMFSAGSSGCWERFRPIGIPVIAGIGWRLGFDPYEFSKIITILFAAASILIVYLIAEKLFDKRIALIAAIIFSITPLFVYYSDYVLTETPSMLFILIGIYALLYDRYFIAGIMGGLGFTFKFTQGIFLIAIGLFLILTLFKSNQSNFKSDKSNDMNDKRDDNDKKNNNVKKDKLGGRFKIFVIRGILLTLGFILAITPYMIFNYVTYHPYTHTLYDATIEPVVSATIFQNNQYQNLATKTIGEQIYGWLYYLINLMASRTFACLLYAFFFVYVYLFFKQKMYNKNEHILLMILFLTYLTYFTSIPYKQERFVYFLIPIAAIYTAYTLTEVYAWTKKIDKKKKNNTMTIILIAIVASFAIISIGIDASLYSWKNPSKPLIVTDIYEYFRNNNITGTIATGDMVLAVYTDNKLTNMFELRADVEGKGSRNIEAVFHADYTYPCLDAACVIDRNKFLSEISEQYNLVKNESCYSGNCYIYIKKGNVK